MIYSNDGDGDAIYVEDFPGELSGDTVRYGYDNNGNMNRDAYKGINSISYNDNNLPEVIDFGSDNKISYFYDASGEKMLRAVSREGGNPEITSYYGLYVHQGIHGGVSSLKYIITPEGRIVNSGSDTSPIWSWEYNLKDHLGNVRAVITPGAVSGSSRVLQQTHYYPYGMRMSQISTTTGTGNDYLFGGKQYQEDFGLNWYDFGARFYDPCGRLGFTTIDPMAENGREFSPYAYCFDNPILMNDPTGMWGEASSFVDPGGTLIEHRDDGDPRVYLVQDPDIWRNNGSKKEDTEQVGYEYSRVDYGRMVGKLAVYYQSKEPFKPGYLNDGPIEKDYTLESLFIPSIGFIKYLKSAYGIYKLIPKNIKMGSQGKHIPGHNNYIEGRSILRSDPQKLLDKVLAKNIKSISKVGDNKVRVDFGEVIGEYVDKATGTVVPTNKAIIHMGKDGAHIVPSKP